MRIHLEVRDAAGTTLAEASVESAVVTIGPGDLWDLHHPRIPVRVDIHHDGFHAIARDPRSEKVVRLKRQNVLALSDEVFLRVDLYPRPDAVPKVRGLCPTCGDRLTEGEVGGAYRSVATEERRCPSCATRVLAIRKAPDVLGRFADRTSDDWVHVTVASRCPKCLASMSRAVFSSEGGRVTVERCVECELVVVDPDDHARLRPR